MIPNLSRTRPPHMSEKQYRAEHFLLLLLLVLVLCCAASALGGWAAHILWLAW